MTGLEEAAQRSDAHRTSFALALEELEHRRRRATDVRYQLKAHAGWFAAGVGFVVLGATTWVWVARARKASRGRRWRRDWKRALSRVYQHPERIASRAADRPLAARVSRGALAALLGAVAAQLAKRAARLLVGDEGRELRREKQLTKG